MCRLRIPRRPAWTEEQSPEQIDAQERAAFLAWRRALAAVEEAERLVLTPFEKNLEVWRQLWRVVERSHIVVQVGGRPIRAILQCCHASAPQSISLPGHGMCPSFVWQWLQGCISHGSALSGCCQSLAHGGSAARCW